MCRETDATPKSPKASISNSPAPTAQRAQPTPPNKGRQSNVRNSAQIPEEIKVEVSSYLPPLEESAGPEDEIVDLDLSSVEVSATE